MSYQPRVRSAIWTTLVLLLVWVSGTSIVAAQSNQVASGAAQSTNANGPAPAPTPPVGFSRGAEKQSEQGRQYGQPGFVGEPINLNVVNADVRDILNYVTEQYGVNFVIDKSVKQVPVTVNVSEVPWNSALARLDRLDRDLSLALDLGFAIVQSGDSRRCDELRLALLLAR